MGNFEKLSVVVIVVIIVMILAVAVVEWTNGPSEAQPGAEPGSEKAIEPLVSPESSKPDPKSKKPTSPKEISKVDGLKGDASKGDGLKGDGSKDMLIDRWVKDPFELEPKTPVNGDPASGGKDTAAKPGEPGTPAPAPAATTSDIPESSYVVGEGDSLSVIAQKVWKRSALWPLIAEANPGVRPEALRKGETIKIPARKGVAATPAGAEASPANGSKPVPGKEYTVQANDTWERISLAAYNTSARWPEIYVKNLNRVGGMKDLAKGKVLMIPK